MSVSEVILDMFSPEEFWGTVILDVTDNQISVVDESEKHTYTISNPQFNLSQLMHPSVQRCLSPWHYLELDPVNNISDLKQWCYNHGKSWTLEPINFFANPDTGYLIELRSRTYSAIVFGTVEDDHHPFQFHPTVRNTSVYELEIKWEDEKILDFETNQELGCISDITLVMEKYWNAGLESAGKLLPDEESWEW